MIGYARFYYIYKSLLFRTIRLFVLLFLVWIIVLDFPDLVLSELKFPLFLLTLFIVFEIFFRFKISRITPSVSLEKANPQKCLDSFTLKALEALVAARSTSLVIRFLLTKEPVKFVLNKANIGEKEIPLIDVPKKEFYEYAFLIAKEIKGDFVTTMDLIVSYLLLIEPKTNLLFNKKLKKEELLEILYWARIHFNEEKQKEIRIDAWGEGIGETLVYGWTYETKKYTRDITYSIKEKPIMVGRDNEYEAVIEALSKPEKNNVILVGEPGIGAGTFIRRLAYDSFYGKLPKKVYHKKFFELMIGQLLAGAGTNADLETRIGAIIDEIGHSGNIIVYLPEVENIFGGSSFNIDLSGALLPHLKDSKIGIIASCTPSNYKSLIEPKTALLNMFEIIKLEEPERDTAVKMVLENVSLIEKKNNVSVTYKAAIKALEIGQRYIPDRVLPGSAITLLIDTANSVHFKNKKTVEEDDVVAKIEEKTKISIAEPKKEEKELLLNLEDSLHKRVIDQNEAITAISEAIRRLRSGLSSGNKPISFLFMGPTGVGKTETAKALADLYFKGEEKMLRFDMSEFQGDDGLKRLLGAPPGQGNEKGELTEKIRDNPFSLVLLDEFEKANPQILDLFLQVLEDGRLTDNKGKTVSFINSIIIATSNAGSEFIREEISKGSIIDKTFQNKLLDLLQTKGIFKPELLNRFDGVIVFKPLTKEHVMEITKLLLNSLTKKLLEKDINVEFDNKILEKIANEGFEEEFGARPIRRYIQDNIEDLIAQKLLKDEIKRGNKVVVSADFENKIITTLS